ncbi:MAG: 23S rRNA (adenine(2503)-C(2))-methyltransferase RlmN [Acidobacteriota bacterium]
MTGAPVAENIFGAHPDEIAGRLAVLGEPPYRARQCSRWIYRRGARSFHAMSDLAKGLRATLAESFVIARPEIAAVHPAADGSRKYDIRLGDGAAIESVLIMGGKRPALCLSSQVGCALGCTFCRTGEMGLARNLSAGEIAAQVVAVQEEAGLPHPAPMSFVFMGMGEPLHNAAEVVRAIGIMTHPDALAISPRRITVSTAGYLPGLETLAAAETGVKLAVSLTSPDDDQRSTLMPVNRRFPIRDVLARVAEIKRRRGQRVTIAYVLLSGVNDSRDHARRLARLVRPMPVKVNLIPFNPYLGSPYRRPGDAAIEAFRSTLAESDVLATVRKTHGDDVLAACGQLASAS